MSNLTTYRPQSFCVRGPYEFGCFCLYGGHWYCVKCSFTRQVHDRPLLLCNEYDYIGLVDPLGFAERWNGGFVKLVSLNSCAVLGMPECSSHPALLSICWASQLGNVACQDRWCKHFQICRSVKQATADWRDESWWKTFPKLGALTTSYEIMVADMTGLDREWSRISPQSGLSESVTYLISCAENTPTWHTKKFYDFRTLLPLHKQRLFAKFSKGKETRSRKHNKPV